MDLKQGSNAVQMQSSDSFMILNTRLKKLRRERALVEQAISALTRMHRVRRSRLTRVK